MSNTKRPSTARKVTRVAKERQDAELDQGLVVKIDGEAFEVRVGEMTPTVARELRRETGMGFMRLMSEMAAEPDVDLIATWVWLARRLRGEVLDLDDVNVTYSDLLSDGFDVALPGGEAPEGDLPEA